MKTIVVCGARPNFMKVAPLLAAMGQSGYPFNPILLHTGQHYDYNMSRAFFEDLDLPEPDIHLGIGGGTQGEQTGRILIEFEKVLLDEKPDLAVVVGDVNSTLAAALAAIKLHIRVAHIEAGLRSFDMTMPEEVNRVLTDCVSHYLFTPSPDADNNLKKEGVAADRIYRVGNIMVDCLLANLQKARQRDTLAKLGLRQKEYAVLTLHRPANVDMPEKLEKMLDSIIKAAKNIPVVFPVHPRTRKNMEDTGLASRLAGQSDRLKVIEPLRYLDFVSLLSSARFVMTDSGGVQPETSVLGVPCLTLRDRTEWVITLTKGTNILVGEHVEALAGHVSAVLAKPPAKKHAPPLWDGKTAERIVEVLKKQN